MSFIKKTWLARIGVGLNRFRMNNSTDVVLESNPVSITQQGDQLSADNMNNLETRIGNAFDEMAGNLATIEVSPSQHNWTVGSQIVYNGILYKVTSAISTDDNLVVGTNIEPYPVSSALSFFDSMLSDIISNIGDRTGLHNGIYRGALLYDATTSTAGQFQSISAIHTAVASGDFSNIYIGDYILIKITTSYKSNETVKMVVAGIDTYLHKGDTELTSHHLTLIPEEAFETTASMNGSHTTAGGYAGSAMYTTVLPIYATALNSALGGYMLTFRGLLSKTVNTSAASGAYSAWSGASSDWAWYSINIRLLSEVQVYGTRVLSSSMFDVGAANVQLPYFLLRPDKLVAHRGYGSSSRCNWWLSAVSYSTHFCSVDSDGYADNNGAGTSIGVRPLVLFG